MSVMPVALRGKERPAACPAGVPARRRFADRIPAAHQRLSLRCRVVDAHLLEIVQARHVEPTVPGAGGDDHRRARQRGVPSARRARLIAAVLRDGGGPSAGTANRAPNFSAWRDGPGSASSVAGDTRGGIRGSSSILDEVPGLAIRWPPPSRAVTCMPSDAAYTGGGQARRPCTDHEHVRSRPAARSAPGVRSRRPVSALPGLRRQPPRRRSRSGVSSGVTPNCASMASAAGSVSRSSHRTGIRFLAAKGRRTRRVSGEYPRADDPAGPTPSPIRMERRSR